MSDVMGGMTAADEAAFAAMENEQAIEPEAEEPEAEAAAETQAEPEPEDEPAEGDEAQPAKKPSMVPHAALHQERERNKRLATELQQAREERARFDERLRVIQEMQKPAAAEPEAIPDPEVDPIAAIKWMREQLVERQRQEAERSQQTAAERQREENTQRFYSQYRSASQEYTRDNPNAVEAYNHFTTALREDYELQGYDQAQAREMAMQHEANIAFAAMQAGTNPLERMVELARRRGWQAKAAPQNAEAKVEKTAEAVTRNKSLASASGAATTGEMTVERLLSMSGDEFHAWTTKNPAKSKRLMGG